MRRCIFVSSYDSELEGLLLGALEEQGYAALPAQQSLELFISIARRQPDLVVLDVRALEAALTLIHMLHLSPMTAHIPLMLIAGDAAVVQLYQDQLVVQHCRIFLRPVDLQSFLCEVDDLLRDDLGASEF